MKMYRFKKEYEDAEIHIPHLRLVINKYNINDETVRMILKKYPKYGHNFEEVQGDEHLISENELVEEIPSEENELVGNENSEILKISDDISEQPTPVEKVSAKPAKTKGTKKSKKKS
jgi:hypothetical protein